MAQESINSIPFNRPFIAGKELHYISQAVLSGHLAGNGVFTKQCQKWLEAQATCKKALLTSSCTGALEMAAILSQIQPGDEVILPSYTFVSTANAFYLRGAKLIFADITADTLNLDPKSVEEKITAKTKVICIVHYAGVACQMDAFIDLCTSKKIILIEDAAHAIGAYYKNTPLGSFGAMSTFSFHETKNFISGEGGALGINDFELIERAEIIWEKGTNRSQFFRGLADKYTWVDIGSSFLPSELIAAFLFAQFEQAEEITRRRISNWEYYKKELNELEQKGRLRLPIIPSYAKHNAHMFYILLESGTVRDGLMGYLRERGILAVFHYIPLHSSPMGMSMNYKEGMFPITESLSRKILRLPLFYDLKREEQDRVVNGISDFLKTSG